MASGKNQKLKLLYLAKIMQEETDDLHRLTMPQLIERLSAYGIEAQRKSIYDDEHFEVKVEVAVSGNFLGWIIGIGGVKIVGPKSVVYKMETIKQRLIEQY